MQERPALVHAVFASGGGRCVAGFYYGGKAGRVAGQSEIKCLDDWVGHYNKSAEKLKPARGDGDGLEERGEARVRRRGFVFTW